MSGGAAGKHVWSNEWENASLGAKPPWQHAEESMDKVLFVESGMGCDQHGDREGGGATKAAVRACRNAIEFNSIPCIQELVPGGRPNMKIKIRLGVPAEAGEVDLGAVCAVFPVGAHGDLHAPKPYLDPIDGPLCMPDSMARFCRSTLFSRVACRSRSLARTCSD